MHSKPRSATIIANEDTTWAVLGKAQFKKILEKHEIQKQENLILSIDSFSLFK